MIKLAWVPDHSNIEGNDIADSLARKGSSNSFVGPEPYIGVPWSTIKSCIDKWLYDKRVEFWNDYPGLEHAKAFMGNLPYILAYKTNNFGHKNGSNNMIRLIHENFFPNFAKLVYSRLIRENSIL